LNLGGLLEVYPDACLVQTHREPARSFASLASVISTTRALEAQRAGGAKPDRKAIGRSVRQLWGAGLERATTVRRDPRIDRAVLDIAYGDTVGDPVGTVKRIYERFDLPFTPQLADRIDQHLAETAKARSGHRYTLEEFGLERAEIETSLPAYRARFGELLGEP
jgi:hypothetical protein